MSKLSKQETVKRINNLRRYQSLDLNAKIRYANRLIEAGLEIADRPFVAWSSGKDSQVLLHLVLQYVPNIDVIFNNTGVEYPETLRHVKRMKEEWNLNLHTAKPKKGKDFWWCLEEFGYPLLGKAFMRKAPFFHSQKQTKVIESGAKIGANCCYYCKERPARQLYREFQVDLLFLGIMAEESRLRTFKYIDYGALRWNKKEKLWKTLPLSIWAESDVWAYHERYNIPICKLYQMGHKRNGCWPCGMDISFENNHLSILRRTHPKLWRFLIVDKGLGETLLKIKLTLNDGQTDLWSYNNTIEELIERRPCFFDRL